LDVRVAVLVDVDGSQFHSTARISRSIIEGVSRLSLHHCEKAR
jgi:hypothetical protein